MDTTAKRVVAARRRTCDADVELEHSSKLKLDDDSEVDEADAIALIDAGMLFTMPHPPARMLVGGPDGGSIDITGEPLALQVRECDACHARVLFA